MEALEWHMKEVKHSHAGTREPRKFSELGRPVTVIGFRGHHSAGQSADLGRLAKAKEREAWRCSNLYRPDCVQRKGLGWWSKIRS